MLLHPNMFYYDDLGNKYGTRIEAVKSKRPCQFHYYDDFFDKALWMIEPVESMPELYRQRAQEIRDNYEYVVLCYSGGIDSTNMLESFYYNGLHIDEIVVVGAFSQDSAEGVDENHNGEIYHNVYPTLNKLNLPNTKVSVFDYTKWFDDPNKFSIIKEHGSDYYKYIGAYQSPHHLFWRDIQKHISEQQKKTAICFGAEKPRWRHDRNTGHFYFQFIDGSFFDYGSIYTDKNATRLNFYSDPTPACANLMRKQLHLIGNYFTRKVLVEKTLSEECFWSNHVEHFISCIYDLKNPLAFTSKKSTTHFLSVRDMYITQKQNTEIYKIYLDAIRKMRKEIVLEKRYHYESKRYYLT